MKEAEMRDLDGESRQQAVEKRMNRGQKKGERKQEMTGRPRDRWKGRRESRQERGVQGMQELTSLSLENSGRHSRGP